VDGEQLLLERLAISRPRKNGVATVATTDAGVCFVLCFCMLLFVVCFCVFVVCFCLLFVFVFVCCLFFVFYRSRFLCEACLGQAPTAKSDKKMTAFDFNYNAEWAKTILSSRAILNAEAHQIPLALINGFVSEMFHREPMHMNEIGCAKDDCAASCVSLVESGLLGEGPADVLLMKLHDKLDDWCETNDVKRPSGPKLSLRVVGRGDGDNCYPELASSWKATDVGTLIFFLAHITQTLCGNNGFMTLVATHMWGLADYMWVCRNSDPIQLNDGQLKRALHAGRAYLLTLQALCNICKQAQLLLFRARPKSHYFDHTLRTLQTSKLNPEMFSSKKHESMLGKLKRIGKNCSKLSVSKRLLQRYLLQMGARFRARKRYGRFTLNPRARRIPVKKNNNFAMFRANLVRRLG
jgi:hypothetical protein